MEFRVLAIGDVVGENGLDLLVRRLRPLKRKTGGFHCGQRGKMPRAWGCFPLRQRKSLMRGPM